MRRPTPPQAVLAVALAAVGVVLVVWLRGSDRAARPTEGAGGGFVHASSSFTISGDMRGAIAPGAMVPLDLSLGNPNDFDLAIDRITVTVRDVAAPRADTAHPCTAADFEVRQLAGGMVPRLAANGADHLSGLGLPRGRWPAVGMLNRPVNQDGCQGAVLTLGYEASGAELTR